MLSGVTSWADLPPWVPALLTDTTGRIMLGLLVAACALTLWGRRGTREKTKPEKRLPRIGGPWIWQRWGMEMPVNIGGRWLDLKWRHIGIVATSGARKSTLLAMLLEQIGKTYVAIAGDHAPPLLNLTLSKGCRVWRPRGDVGWYPWGGDLELAVQRVEHMFPTTGNDAGVHRSMFKQAARKAWAAVPENARTVEQVIAMLPSTGTSTKTMTENWGARLKELVESLGESLTTGEAGGFDLVECVRRGESVMFALNSFADVSNRERFAKIAILETLRAADDVGNLSVAMDEVGLMGADLFAESVRTLRVRLCTGMFASHIAKDFPEVLRGIINVWFLGQIPGSDKNTREWMSHTTFSQVPPEHFGEHDLPLGRFYLVANGRQQRLTVPTWKTRPVPAVPTATLESEPEVRLTDTCVRWEGSHAEKGYGRVWISALGEVKGHYEYVHILEWEKHNGPIPRDEDGQRSMDVDHVCQTRDCWNIEHLSLKEKAEHGRVTRARAAV